MTEPEVAERRPKTLRNIIGTGVGNALEWYDWGVYAAFTLYISTHLFDPKDPTSALLSTLAIFAVGFVARPIGGLAFGWVADRKGRKFSLMLAVGLASFGSLLIGVAPTYATAGSFASLLLLVARLVQGLAHGGELPSAQTYLSEQAPRERRGLWSSWIYFSGTLGNVVALVLGAVLTTALSESQMNSWGWRLPFLLGAVLGLFALYMRTGMDESEVFEHDVEEEATPQPPFFRTLAEHWRTALQVIGMTAGATVAYYAWAVQAPAYAQASLKIDPGGAFVAGLGANAVFLVCLPLWGMVSDRVGRKPVLWIALLGSAVLFYPMSRLLRDAPWQLFVSMSVMLVFLAAFSSIGPAVYAEMFPTHVRAAGFGFPYSIAIAAFGGTAPLIQAALLTSTGSITAFALYAIGLLLVSAVTVATLRETRGVDLHERAEAVTA